MQRSSLSSPGPLRATVLIMVAAAVGGCGGSHDSIGAGASLPAITDSMGAPEPMPRGLRDKLVNNGHRLDAEDLRLANAQHLGSTLVMGLWVVEGPSITCILLDRPSASACDSSDEVRRHGIYVQTDISTKSFRKGRRQFLAVGVPPSNYQSVRATVDGRPVDAQMYDGMFIVRAQQPIRVLLPG